MDPEPGEDHDELEDDLGGSGSGGSNGEHRAERDGHANTPGDGSDGGYEGDEDEDAELEEEREETGESVTIEIAGLSLYTHHGASAAEREVGQRLVLDLRLELGESDATVTDSIADTVDYGEVCQLVALIAQQRSHRTLERLCSTIADRLIGDYELEAVWVKATKPEPPIPLPVDEVSVEVWREAEE
jgi:dihydroneopterin aldolase